MSTDHSRELSAESYSSIVSQIAHETLLHSPTTMPDTAPWWQHLECNFHQRPVGFELDLLSQLLVSSTALSDVLLRTAAASMVASLAMPLGFRPKRLKEAIDDSAFYEELAIEGDASRFFIQPPKYVSIKESQPSWPYFKPEGGRCVSLSFRSPFRTVNPRMQTEYNRHENNKIARARYWHHNDGPRPTIFAIHGFFADPYWLNSWFFALPWFYRMGCDVMLYTLPFHGARQSRSSPFSGHGYFSGGISRMNEAVAQAVYDFRIFLNYLLKERKAPKAGVTGISLGGYTAAILAAVEDRLEFSIPNVPVVSIADLVMEWFPVSAMVKSYLLMKGQSVKELRRMVAVHCPLTYKPILPRDRLMIIGGVGDRLAPPTHSRILWDHWARCRIHWFPGSHVLHWDKGDYLREIAKFLTQIDFIDDVKSPAWASKL